MGVRLGLALGLLAFVANPMACSTDEFDYDEADMRRAVEGTWSVTPLNRETTPFSFVIAQAGGASSANGPSLVSPAAACNNRDFVKSAAGCSSSSSILVEGRVDAGHPAFGDQRITGSFEVGGRWINGGRLMLSLAAPAPWPCVSDRARSPAAAP